jgi:hypothetical protein
MQSNLVGLEIESIPDQMENLSLPHTHQVGHEINGLQARD